ncbi:hypothetical protein [Maridesulfovibrio ferrireducens]|uniref:hypothetical protein n=1 Tax=Maridesulfovibrio ferrireducens TaxID=246191 RepID=UPI0026EBCDA7|nr:hypothetical protein [Maridesulfovibrio ferrireducens]
MKKTTLIPTPQKKISTKVDPKVKTIQKKCEIFVLTNENWNVHQDDRANIMNADFHQMESARNTKSA